MFEYIHWEHSGWGTSNAIRIQRLPIRSPGPGQRWPPWCNHLCSAKKNKIMSGVLPFFEKRKEEWLFDVLLPKWPPDQFLKTTSWAVYQKKYFLSESVKIIIFFSSKKKEKRMWSLKMKRAGEAKHVFLFFWPYTGFWLRHHWFQRSVLNCWSELGIRVLGLWLIYWKGFDFLRWTFGSPLWELSGWGNSNAIINI